MSDGYGPSVHVNLNPVSINCPMESAAGVESRTRHSTAVPRAGISQYTLSRTSTFPLAVDTRTILDEKKIALAGTAERAIMWYDAPLSISHLTILAGRMPAAPMVTPGSSLSESVGRLFDLNRSPLRRFGLALALPLSTVYVELGGGAVRTFWHLLSWALLLLAGAPRTCLGRPSPPSPL